MCKIRSDSTKIAFIVVMATLTMACKKDHNISDRQQILFQYDYSNNAWGSQHNGFLIDNNGNILLYNNLEDWNYHDKFLVLTEEQVNENIRKCELSTIKIPKEELHKYTNYIRNIASSQVSAKRNIANDAGITEFICYQYSESTGTYEGHLIKMEGDYTCENLNFYSKKVATWMRGIENNIGSR